MMRTRTLLALSLIASAAATARADSLYVSEANDRVVRYDTTAVPPTPTTILTATSKAPMGLVFDGSGNLLVSYEAANRIEKYSPTGADLGPFATTGLNVPIYLAKDASNNIYAVNGGDNTIEKFTPSGTPSPFISFGLNGPAASALAFDTQGNVYVTLQGPDKVEKFSPTGTDLGAFATTGLSGPNGLAFDALGNLFVANAFTNSIEKFSPTGTDLGAFATTGLNLPQGLIFDSLGNLYAANDGFGAFSNTIARYTPGGAYSLFATTPANPFAFAIPTAAVPEPSSLAMLVSGLAGVLVFASGRARAA